VTEMRHAPQTVAVVVAVPSATGRRVAVAAVLAPLAWLGLTSAGGGLTYAPLVWLVLVTGIGLMQRLRDPKACPARTPA
jgi:hypothetical protein